jgi:hypothetical protein
VQILLLFFLSSLVCVQAESEFVEIPNFMYEEQVRNHKEESLIEINSVSYLRNTKASFCSRPTDMIDTIVLHHSESRNTDTPEDINRYHLSNGSAADPWYMIAYSLVIMAPYQNETTPLLKAFYGRPLNIVGAHAGSGIFVPMDAVQKNLWAQKQILCGKEYQMEYDKTLVKNGKIKANVTTIGLVINGNYAPFSGPKLRNGKPNRYQNPNGFLPAKEPTFQLIDSIARLSCQMQKEYPRIKTLAYHDQYHQTSCPGSIQEIEHLKAIKDKAKEYGCEFKLLPGKLY